MREQQPIELLTALGAAIDWPQPSPHLPGRVKARIVTGRTPSASPWRRLAPVLAMLVVLMGAVLVWPDARAAVADALTRAGVRIGFWDEAPTPGAGLDLGEPVGLEDAAAGVGFGLRVPAEGLGAPDGVYARGGQVSMVWMGDRELPAAGDTGIGVLLTQSSAAPGDELAIKRIGPETGLVEVTVEDSPGLWIAGAPHTFAFLDADGETIEITTRLAANVLLWERDGVSHRLETTGDYDHALAIAQSLRPIFPDRG